MFQRRLVSHAHARLLEEHARRMRFAPTRAEEWLWRRLAGSRTGFPFRRQLVIANFIVDFASPKVRLVVELDGAYHQRRGPQDAAREPALAELGWRVIRFRDDEVLTDIDSVVARIVQVASR